MKLRRPIDLYLVVFFFLAVHGALILRPHIFEFDEAVYVAIGKYLFSHGTVGLFDDQRPLIIAFILGLIWKAGLPVSICGEMVILAFSALLICLVYKIGSTLFDRKAAFFSALLLAVSPVYFHYSSLFFTEIPSALFALLALFCYMKKRPFASGILAGIAFLTKFPQALIFISLLAVLVTEGLYCRNSRDSLRALLKDALFISGGFLLALLPFLIFNMIVYSNINQSLFRRLFHPVFALMYAQSDSFREVKGFWESRLYYFIMAARDNPLLIFSALGFLLFFTKERLRDLQSRVLLCAFVVTYGYFVSIVTRDMRYVNILLPYFALFSGAALSWLYRCFEKRSAGVHCMLRNAAAGLSLFVLVAGINRALCGVEESCIMRPCEEPPMIRDYGRYFSKNPAKGAILTCDPIPAGYCDCFFIQYFSVEAAEKEMKKENVEYVIFNIVVFREYFVDKAYAACMDAFVEKLFRENRIVAEGDHFNGTKYYIVKLNRKEPE
ncbi:MAG: ArnT family glycosyltransferase [Candidatus Xenobiia bacterium LiM19]